MLRQIQPNFGMMALVEVVNQIGSYNEPLGKSLLFLPHLPPKAADAGEKGERSCGRSAVAANLIHHPGKLDGVFPDITHQQHNT